MDHCGHRKEFKVSETKAKASHEDAKKLAGKGAGKATVLGRHAIVHTQAWGPGMSPTQKKDAGFAALEPNGFVELPMRK